MEAPTVDDILESPIPEQDDEPEVQGTPQERDEAAERAQQCSDAIHALLKRFHCRIMPFINDAEPVGVNGDRVQITASYGIAPLPKR